MTGEKAGHRPCELAPNGDSVLNQDEVKKKPSWGAHCFICEKRLNDNSENVCVLKDKAAFENEKISHQKTRNIPTSFSLTKS